MKTKDVLRETYISLTSNKARSALTMLGIVIGIGSVITMLAFGTGTKKFVESSIQSIGSNLLTIRPGSQRSFGGVSNKSGSAGTLVWEDFKAIEKEIDFIKNIAPEVSSRYQIVYMNNNANTSVLGTTPSYQKIRALDMSYGSFFTDIQLQNKNKAAVLGAEAYENLFSDGEDPIGKSIRINNMIFKVIGVTESKGSSFMSSDDVVYLPITVSQAYFTGDNILSSISVEAESQENMEQVEAGILALLLSRHNITNADDADFQISNMADLMSMASETTSAFTSLLGSIAAISLLVGGIGIMNMMLTTVTERKKEIGLRMAIGAQKSEISLQFLSEAIALTFVGGLIGIMLGFVLSWVMKKFFGIAIFIETYSVVLSFGVSAAIGIIFGYYPAKKASNLNPIEALKYE